MIFSIPIWPLCEHEESKSVSQTLLASLRYSIEKFIICVSLKSYNIVKAAIANRQVVIEMSSSALAPPSTILGRQPRD